MPMVIIGKKVFYAYKHAFMLWKHGLSRMEEDLYEKGENPEACKDFQVWKGKWH